MGILSGNLRTSTIAIDLFRNEFCIAFQPFSRLTALLVAMIDSSWTVAI
jgi:hypothetical protein